MQSPKYKNVHPEIDSDSDFDFDFDSDNDIDRELDYIRMKETIIKFNRELFDYVFHPDRLNRLSSKYDLKCVDLLILYQVID